MAMADGYAQASGKLAVVNLHVAPGLGNAMGMLYDAQKAASPILVTAGQHEQSFTATEPILWADLPTIARPFVKWSGEVHRLADLPRLVHRAAKTALAPPTGPVFLSLPGDILNAEARHRSRRPTRVAPRAARRPRRRRGGRRRCWPARAPGDHGRRCGGAEPRACRAGRACRAHRRARLRRVRAEHRVVPVLASAVSRRDGAARAGGAQGARTSTTCCSPSAPTCSRCRCRPTSIRCRPSIDADPSRPRSLGARQELSGRGRDPGRPEGDACRS